MVVLLFTNRSCLQASYRQGALAQAAWCHRNRSYLCGSSRLNSRERAEDPLVGSIAQQLLTDREAHDKTAAEWTRRYAQG